MKPTADGRPKAAQPVQVVLGSGSRYRRELLERLLPAFEVVVPAVDEAPRPNEGAAELAARLARLKATAVSRQRPVAVVIGSDQVAECEGRNLGKPGSADGAVSQLLSCSGRTLTLHTAVCVIGPVGTGAELSHLDRTSMQFRTLTPAIARRYVARDQPLDCAGSFRFEGLGASLFAEVWTRDPTAIQGLPLIWLTGALASFGIEIP
jgi:septum formation protein